MEKLQRVWRRHPLVRDAFFWVLPAFIFGAVLRALLMSYLPYAFWGPDSRSYYTFAHKLFYNGWISLGEKRRFLYPILMVPVSALPGGALRWLPVVQHTVGLATLFPLAYAVRKSFRFWKLWIVPVTMFYAGFPVIVWSEHELLGENIFFATLVWAFAGWMAWVGQDRVERSRRMYGWFLVPFALFILTKPAGRFVWPGIFIGLVMVGAWRLLTWKQAVALLAVLLISPFVGSKKQGAWLFYTATFPLTRLETPLHAEYKAEIRDLVMRMRSNLDNYYEFEHDEPFFFLRDPDQQRTRPLWAALGLAKNEKLKDRIYMDLALEGVKARPDLFLYLAVERILRTANVSSFDVGPFSDGCYSAAFDQYYKEAYESEDSPVRLALGLPNKGPIPEYEGYRQKLEPAPGSWRARVVQACVGAYGERFDYFRFPKLPKEKRKIGLVRPTFLCGWLVAGLFLSLLPRYRRTLGVWAILAVGYILAVFLVALVNMRYFVPAWPVLLVVMAVPAEVICVWAAGRWAQPVTREERGNPKAGIGIA